MSTCGNTTTEHEKVTALILAAGEGTRLGNRPKAFLKWRGQTLLQHAIERVVPFANQIIVGVRENDVEAARALCGDLSSVRIIVGGQTRLQTLEILSAQANSEIVLIHEAARPFASDALFERVLSKVFETGIAVPAVKLPVRDGIGLQSSDKLELQLPREQLVALQTPQAFSAEVLQDVLRRTREEELKADSLPGLARLAGYSVHLVEGCKHNVKITYEDDLKLLTE